MPPITIKAILDVVLETGLKPIFVDINDNDFSYNLEDLKSKINKNTKAILISYLYGIVPDVDEIIKTKGLVQIQDESLLEEVAKKVIDSNPDQVAAYKAGKDKLFGFFVGQVMKETQGKANPKTVNQLLKEILDSIKI